MDTFEIELVAVRSRLVAYAKQFLKGDGDAEDLVQDTLLRAMRSRERYTPGTSMIAWTYVIMRNLFLSQRRRRKIHRPCSIDEMSDHSDFLGVEAEQEWHVHLSDAAEAFAELKPGKQHIIALVALEGMRLEEVAEQLDIPVGTVKSRVWRARGELAARVDGTHL